MRGMQKKKHHITRNVGITIGALCAALFLLVVAALMFAKSRLPDLDARVATRDVSNTVRIVRDSWGVPHIIAENESDAYFALGYAMAQDRLFQMDLLRRIAGGELAEVLGAKLVPIDKLMRAFGLRAKAADFFEDEAVLPADLVAIMDAFIKGVNTFMERESLPVEFSILQFTPRPFTKVDCLAVSALLPITFADGLRGDPLHSLLKAKHPELDIAQLFPGYSFGDPVTIMESREESAGIRVSQGVKTKALVDDEVALALAEVLEPLGWISETFGPALGSNSTVLSGSRTASDKAILANDPHVAFTNPSIWYEAHMKYGDYEAYGYHLPPICLPLMAHNGAFGWGLTMFANDDVDLYFEEFDPEDRARVRSHGEWTHAQIVREHIAVRFGRDVDIDVRVTPHGPVITDLLTTLGIDLERPVALSWIWQKLPYTDLLGFYRMANAKSYEDFEAGVSLITSPGINVSYADRDGTIAWWAAGRVAIRPPHVNSKEVLDGASGKDELIGYLPFDLNPHLKNPPSGYIVTANNLPTFKPLGPDEVTLQGYWQPVDRALRLKTLIEAREDWTVESLQAVQLDDTTATGPDFLPLLLSIAEGAEACPDDARPVLALMKNWNYSFSAESPQALVYQYWVDEIMELMLQDELTPRLMKVYRSLADSWNFFKGVVHDESSPFWDNIDSEVVETREDVVLAALIRSLALLREEFGPNPGTWKWSDAHTLTLKHPLGYLPGPLSVFNIGPMPVAGAARVVNNMLYEGELHNYEVIAGPSTRRLIDFAQPELAKVILPSGNSGNVMSPNYADQAAMFVSGQYRTTAFSAGAIEEQKAHEIVIHPPE